MQSHRAPSLAIAEGIEPSASPSAVLHCNGSRHRLAIVSRHRLCRDALVAILVRVPTLQLAGVMTPEDAGRCAVVFDVAVIDSRLGDTGAALVDRLRRYRPRLSVVVIGAAEGAALGWVGTRVAAYVDPDGSAAEITAAVLRAARGGSEPSRGLLELALSDIAPLPTARRSCPNVSMLTPREQVVLQLAAEGLANKEIARCLKISESTVKNHMHNVLDKMGARRRGEAAARFRRERDAAVPLAPPGWQPTPVL